MGDTREGDNLYSNSVIALDVHTGKLVGYHQYHWNDSWDWDEVTTPLLIDFQRGAKTVHGLVHAGRDGYLWFLARDAKGINFVDALPYVQQNVFTSINPRTGRPAYDLTHKPGTQGAKDFCPSFWGGKDWPPVAYSPRTRLLYIPANENLCARLAGEPVQYEAGQIYMGVQPPGPGSESGLLPTPDAAHHIGEIQAWRVDGKPERVWTHEFKGPNWGPLLVTAGDLLFAGGTNDRAFRAFDARSGEVLWEQRTSSGVTGVPITYEVDDVQYVAVFAGWGVDAERMQALLNEQLEQRVPVPQGGVLWVFALAPQRE